MSHGKENKIRPLRHLAQAVFRSTNWELRKGVPWWPALVAVVVIGVAYIFLSDQLTIGPNWLLLAFLAILVVPVIISRLKGNHRVNHLLLLGICGLVTLAEFIGVGLLLISLPAKIISATSLLRDAALLWGSNIVIFSLWYWQVDGGGPYTRSHEACQDYHQQAELLFPVLTLIEQQPRYSEWCPGFLDYLFVALIPAQLLALPIPLC